MASRIGCRSVSALVTLEYIVVDMMASKSLFPLSNVCMILPSTGVKVSEIAGMMESL